MSDASAYDTTPEQRALIAHLERAVLSSDQSIIHVRVTFSTDCDETLFLETSRNLRTFAHFMFECGSDDDDYVFINVLDPSDIIRLPLMPE